MRNGSKTSMRGVCIVTTHLRAPRLEYARSVTIWTAIVGHPCGVLGMVTPLIHCLVYGGPLHAIRDSLLLESDRGISISIPCDVKQHIW